MDLAPHDDVLARVARPAEHAARTPLPKAAPTSPPVPPRGLGRPAHRDALPGTGRPPALVELAPDATRSPATAVTTADVPRGALDLVVGRRPAAPAPVARDAVDDGGSGTAGTGTAGEIVAAHPGDDAAAAAESPADLAGLADRLWDHLEPRLRRSLLLERERRGLLPDL